MWFAGDRDIFFKFFCFKHKSLQTTSTPNALLKILTKGLITAIVKIHFIATSLAWFSEVITEQITMSCQLRNANQKSWEYVSHFQCQKSVLSSSPLIPCCSLDQHIDFHRDDTKTVAVNISGDHFCKCSRVYDGKKIWTQCNWNGRIGSP